MYSSMHVGYSPPVESFGEIKEVFSSLVLFISKQVAMHICNQKHVPFIKMKYMHVLFIVRLSKEEGYILQVLPFVSA